MASSLLYTGENPISVPSGDTFQPAIAQLYAKETNDVDARLNSVSMGVISTLINYNSFGIKGYPVVDDTPSINLPAVDLVNAYLYAGIVVSSGNGRMKRWTGTEWKSIDTLVVFR